jgi:hypothetical protein
MIKVSPTFLFKWLKPFQHIRRQIRNERILHPELQKTKLIENYSIP